MYKEVKVMELNYEENKNALDKYISECRNKIMNTFFCEDELKKGLISKLDITDLHDVIKIKNKKKRK